MCIRDRWSTSFARYLYPVITHLPLVILQMCIRDITLASYDPKAGDLEFSNVLRQSIQLAGIMVGRGIIADPALFREARGGAPAAWEELRGYLDDLYHCLLYTSTICWASPWSCTRRCSPWPA